MDDLRDLEAFAQVRDRAADLEPTLPQLQKYMRRALLVIDALLALGMEKDQALFWFRCFPVGGARERSPVIRVAKDPAEDVIVDLKVVFEDQRDTLAPYWEHIRQDTLSVQRDIFRDVRMVTAQEAAAVCGVSRQGKSDLDLARELVRSKAIFYFTSGGQPYFPAYQFSGDGPKPIVAKILATLSPFRSSWEIAVWFWGNNGWLDGDTPEELIDSEPELLLDAAFQEVVEEMEAAKE